MNKVALITGSTSGIGLGIAKVLASKGYSIGLNGFGVQSQIDQLKNQLSSENKVKVEYFAHDLLQKDQLKDLISSVHDKFGNGVSVLVNNAGMQHIDKIEDFPEETFEKVISINLSAAYYLTKYSIPFMKEQNWGRIINIASVHGLVASVNKSAYVVSKHGIIGLTKSVALEMARTGITCNAICPGWVLTDLIRKQIDLKKLPGESFDEASQRILSEKTPSLQFVTPEDLGNASAFLCSEAAKEIRGISLPIDGGWTAQ